ncbi:ABC transporter permease [Candidatus Parcubacteria bacterium]|nr:ABC transporter permease [Candidatus Parcubacteria bacterium]
MMRLDDMLKLATRMFRTRPARTWLTILGIGVGFAAVVILVGLGFGLQGVLLEKIVFGEAMLSLNVVTPPSRVVVIENEQLDQFKQLPNVQDVASLASFTSLITFGDLTGSIMLNGVEPKYFRYAGIVAQHGELFENGQADYALLSSAVLKLFDMEPEDIIGQKASFKVFLPIDDGEDEVREIPLNKEYTIKGIIEDDASIFAYVAQQELSSQFVIPYYEKARVKVTDRIYLDSAEAQILELGFIVTALSKTVEQANKIFAGVQVALALFGAIALIVSAIGMFNTMTVTLLERTKEIGIMRTIGGSPLNIKVMFLTESVLMGFLGGVVGIGIGVGGGLTINFMLNTLATRMGGAPMALFRFPMPFLIFIAVFSGVMGYVTGLFPSKRAGKLNPLDAIRYS